MSYNETPKWASVSLATPFNALVCPDCKSSLAAEFQSCLAEVQTAGYYHPAHIPPELIVTCPGCDTDYCLPIEVKVLRTGRLKKC